MEPGAGRLGGGWLGVHVKPDPMLDKLWSLPGHTADHGDHINDPVTGAAGCRQQAARQCRDHSSVATSRLPQLLQHATQLDMGLSGCEPA